MTRYTCALCGRPTTPFVFIGAEAVGPKCAQAAGLTAKRITKLKGHRMRLARMPVVREKLPQTIDMFDFPQPRESA